jgi:biotin synthase-related radical SAM superfamily protein
MLRTGLNSPSIDTPLQWRVSSGTAVVLGLATLRMDTAPSTAYIMLGERCLRNCAYCAQAHGSTASEAALSRVTWPEFPAAQITHLIEDAYSLGTIRRVCLQVTVGRTSMADCLQALALLKHAGSIPVCCSVSLERDTDIADLLTAGADQVTLALDAASERIYQQVRGNDWHKLVTQLEGASQRFPNRLSTHLIVGLGETEHEVVDRLQSLADHSIGVGLFAFTPLAGTPLAGQAPPDLAVYRRMQLARWLVVAKHMESSRFRFDELGRLTGYGIEAAELRYLLQEGTAFRTSGCPDCNRPYYNERPGGVMYNYARPLSAQESAREIEMLFATLAF